MNRHQLSPNSYDDGYSDGWRAAMEFVHELAGRKAHPPKPSPITDDSQYNSATGEWELPDFDGGAASLGQAPPPGTKARPRAFCDALQQLCPESGCDSQRGCAVHQYDPGCDCENCQIERAEMRADDWHDGYEEQ